MVSSWNFFAILAAPSPRRKRSRGGASRRCSRRSGSGTMAMAPPITTSKQECEARLATRSRRRRAAASLALQLMLQPAQRRGHPPAGGVLEGLAFGPFAVNQIAKQGGHAIRRPQELIEGARERSLAASGFRLGQEIIEVRDDAWNFAASCQFRAIVM